MITRVKIVLFVLIGLSILFQPAFAGTISDGPVTDGKAVLKAMKEEVTRSMRVLGKKATPPPYFISYRITDTNKVEISASFGSLKKNRERRNRILDVDVRVGDHTLDSSHKLRGNRFDFDFSMPVDISLSNDADAIKSALWLETDKKYKAASEKLIKVKADKEVRVKEEDLSDDFSREKPVTHVDEPVNISGKVDIAAWEKKVKEYSALFNNHPDIYESTVALRVEGENKYFVNSEGSSLLHGRTYWFLLIRIETKADDGMELFKSENFDARTMANLPDDKTVKEKIAAMIKDLAALRQAPVMEPYTGPAILSGEAAAVFFHEIFGHRIEGSRQKNENDGQTFTKKLNQKILPDFLSVHDDPSIKKYGNADLNGHYLYDDEGVKSQRVNVVENGILKRFLMSRSPVKGHPNSNGHGRAQAGRKTMSRQGNLIMTSSKTFSKSELRKKLLEACKKEGKPYGLFFEDITGGFTFTGRFLPQAFNVTPVTVYRVYVDGRQDELVRGVNLIGTPLTSFSKVIACGDNPGVFTGYCGAESGSIPVSAVCPPVLTGQIEVQKKVKASDKPPVLPPPVRR